MGCIAPASFTHTLTLSFPAARFFSKLCHYAPVEESYAHESRDSELNIRAEPERNADCQIGLFCQLYPARLVMETAPAEAQLRAAIQSFLANGFTIALTFAFGSTARHGGCDYWMSSVVER